MTRCWPPWRRSRSPARPSPRPSARRCGRPSCTASTATSPLSSRGRKARRAGRASPTSISSCSRTARSRSHKGLASLSPQHLPLFGRCQESQGQGSGVDQFLQHVLNGVVLGGTYALLGIGLTLIFGIMRVVNFTHGELYAFGAYLAYLFVALLHLDFFVALAL